MSETQNPPRDQETVAAPSGQHSLMQNLPYEMFKLATEQAAIAITITDPAARILYANPCFEKTTGYSAEEIIGKNQSVLSYKVTPRMVYESLWGQLSRKKPWNGLLVNRRKDGSRYLADLAITPVLDEDGEILYFLGLHRDVSDVHKLEHELLNQKALIESAFDATQAAMVTIDRDLKPVMQNQSFRRLSQHVSDHSLQKLRKNHQPEDSGSSGPYGDNGFLIYLLSQLEQNYPDQFDPQQVFEQGFPALELEIYGEKMVKPIWLSCSGSVVQEQDTSADFFYDTRYSSYLLLTLQDITDLKEQQNQLHLGDLKALLQEQERIRSVREALSGAIYQLDGPLNMVNAARNLVARKSHLDTQELHKLFTEVKEAGEKTLQTLSACMPEPYQETTSLTNVNEVLRNTLGLLTPRMLASGVIVDWQPQTYLPKIQACPTELTTLFKQLLDNALDALESQSAKDTHHGERELKVSTHYRKRSIEVQIQDNGPGIPAAEQLKVFEPFYTRHAPNENATDGKGKKQSNSHLGMGLTLAQDIVIKHQGLIEIDQNYTHGCRIKVQLPHV